MNNFSFSNIQLSFEGRTVLSNCSSDYNFGDRVLIYGENGIGKTSLLKILSGHLISFNGEIKFRDSNFSDLSFSEIKREIIFISSDENTLYPRLTGLENIEYFSKILNIDFKERLDRWSKIKLFSESLNTPFHKCSQGMKRIISLFVFTLSAPKVLIMDECFKSFSPSNRELIYQVLNEELKESIFIFSSHHNESFKFIENLKVFKLDGGLIAN